ncbi:hypothetical protein [Pectobacterium brasiliense]|uniref:hypothetical protein n=1 Tax=Pectobacterium brasiliense TaxID=180957 RepID=UPI0013F46D93|nr:hypothetical protein [Pectobacterium brasiliense]
METPICLLPTSGDIVARCRNIGFRGENPNDFKVITDTLRVASANRQAIVRLTQQALFNWQKTQGIAEKDIPQKGIFCMLTARSVGYRMCRTFAIIAICDIIREQE